MPYHTVPTNTRVSFSSKISKYKKGQWVIECQKPGIYNSKTEQTYLHPPKNTKPSSELYKP